MLDEEWDSIIVHRGEDRSFPIVITSIHVRAELQQFLLYIGEKRFV